MEELLDLCLVNKIIKKLAARLELGDQNLAEFLVQLAAENQFDKEKFASNPLPSSFLKALSLSGFVQTRNNTGPQCE